MEKAKEYSRLSVILSVVSLFFSLLLLYIALASGLSRLFSQWAHAISPDALGSVFFYFLFFSLYIFICNAPLSWFSSYYVEHIYGLSNQSVAAWLWHEAKKGILGFALGLLIVEAVYFFIRVFPGTWWLWCWAFSFTFSIILGKLVPVFIVPLFYKYSEIADKELIETIKSLVRNTKLQISNVYSLNLSKTTKKANAAFMGLGKTKRVVLADTLLEQFSAPEIISVVAHEIGHFVHQHIWKHISLATVVSFAEFLTVAYIAKLGLAYFKIDALSNAASLPLIYGILSLLSVLIMPVQNAYSRLMEREADTYALNVTKAKDGFISAMQKLSTLNLSDPSPHPAVEWFLFSHPSIEKRIEFARTYTINETE